MSATPLRRVAVVALYTLREGLKNRVLWIAFVFALVGVGFAGFIGDVAVVEHRRVETALLAAAFRFCAALVAMIFVISTVVREFNDKCLELYLSLPVSRVVYFCGKLAGFFAAGAVVAAVFSAVLLFYAPPAAVGWWFVSLSCELAVVSALALFCVLTFNQQIPASFAAAFFFLHPVPRERRDFVNQQKQHHHPDAGEPVYRGIPGPAVFVSAEFGALYADGVADLRRRPGDGDAVDFGASGDFCGTAGGGGIV